MQLSVAMHFETDLLDDAAWSIHHVFRQLVHHHGDRFRSLERRIEDLCEDVESGVLVFEDAWQMLEPGRAILLVPLEMRQVLDEARELGVL